MVLKGIVFTMDMIIGLSLVIVLLFLVSLRMGTNYSEISFQSLGYQSTDLINFLSIAKVGSFSDTTTIHDLSSNNIITPADLNRTLLDLIGSFWYSGNRTIASNITKEILDDLANYCFSLQTQNETIYSSCNYTTDNIAVSYKIASGYEIGKPVSGFIARAWATKVKKNTTQIVPFYPEGSGWTANRVDITKKFYLPQDITIYNATLYVSIHYGTTQTQAEFQELKVNGVQKKTDVVWLYMQEDSNPPEYTTAAYGVVDVTNQIRAGNNSIDLAFGTPNYNSHIHPGMRLIVTYSLTQDMFTPNQTINKRYYLDNVIGRSGAWSMVSFYIPENSTGATATLNLNAQNVDDTKYFAENATDVQIYVNSNTTFYKDGTTNGASGCYSYKDKGYYCDRDIVGVMNPRLSLDITDSLINGTNVVSIYLNNYGDIHWGSQDSIIYSDPVNGPDNSSYVEVSYTLVNPIFNYGEIDITKERMFGGSVSNPKTFNFTLSGGESRIIESFTHIAQGFSSLVKVYSWWDDLEKSLVFTSPSSRIVPENVYIYPTLLGLGENHIEIADVQPDGTYSNTNYILPWSSFEYTYLVKGLIGYGGVFNTSQAAVDDATQRLITQMGLEGISVEGIETESESVQGIQWLWGPGIFKILSWERT